MNFAYEPAGKAPATASAATPSELGRLYLHTGKGRKTAALEHSGRVCVAITTGEAFERGTSPCKDGFAFRSVLVEGRATLVEDEAEQERALRAIVAKYDPAAASLPFGAKNLAATLVYTVAVERVTYKERPRRRPH
jgi:nitroimidazol reductase NimA-like FMN-containing flavoprotein (pyridoxamine 5'-phosphate oxidase superfamily)